MSSLTKSPLGSQKDTAPAPAKKQLYQAFSLAREEQRYLEIRPKFPDPAECLVNAMLKNIRADSRMGVALTLAYGDAQHLSMMVTIKGENLVELYRALKEWKVDWIAEFSPSEHEEPEDSSAPFVRSITIHTKRPEEIPSHIKRH
jgi:hypothetical protein